MSGCPCVGRPLVSLVCPCVCAGLPPVSFESTVSFDSTWYCQKTREGARHTQHLTHKGDQGPDTLHVGLSRDTGPSTHLRSMNRTFRHSALLPTTSHPHRPIPGSHALAAASMGTRHRRQASSARKAGSSCTICAPIIARPLPRAGPVACLSHMVMRDEEAPGPCTPHPSCDCAPHDATQRIKLVA